MRGDSRSSSPTVPATDLLSQAAETLSSTASASGIAFKVDAAASVGNVCCDASRVMQILGNVVGNAVKFTPKGGSITLSASGVGEEVQFSVRDTGPGIAPEMLDHLFERYWQAEAGAQKGRGLGLYIAKQLVEAQGGRIWAESRPGAGTTILFTFPRSNVSGGDRRVADRSASRPARFVVELAGRAGCATVAELVDAESLRSRLSPGATTVSLRCESQP